MISLEECACEQRFSAAVEDLTFGFVYVCGSFLDLEMTAWAGSKGLGMSCVCNDRFVAS